MPEPRLEALERRIKQLEDDARAASERSTKAETREAETQRVLQALRAERNAKAAEEEAAKRAREAKTSRSSPLAATPRPSTSGTSTIYGLGGVVLPFPCIKAIDVLLTALRLV